MSALMTTAVLGAIVHPAWPFHPLWWIHPLVGLVWLAVIVTVIVLIARRARRGGWWHERAQWHQAQQRAWAAQSAETVLAERFARGDIDEKEYRARLEVLRASGTVPPAS